MGRILAIDYGLKRTGIAVTDSSQIIATALETIPTSELFEYLKKYFASEEVDEIVVGKPMRLDNTPTHLTEPVNKLISQLRKSFPDKTVTLQDERFTSKIAMQTMIAGGVKKKQRRKKENLDKISATLILQTYLESLRNR